MLIQNKPTLNKLDKSILDTMGDKKYSGCGLDTFGRRRSKKSSVQGLLLLAGRRGGSDGGSTFSSLNFTLLQQLLQACVLGSERL
jgi:hypothetical protein